MRLLEIKEGTIRAGRDVVLFVLGTAGIVHETVIAERERPVLIVLFAAMVGLTGVIRSTEVDVRSDRRGDEES